MFEIFIPYQNMFQHIMFPFSIIDTHKQRDNCSYHYVLSRSEKKERRYYNIYPVVLVNIFISLSLPLQMLHYYLKKTWWEVKKKIIHSVRN